MAAGLFILVARFGLFRLPSNPSTLARGALGASILSLCHGAPTWRLWCPVETCFVSRALRRSFGETYFVPQTLKLTPLRLPSQCLTSTQSVYQCYMESCRTRDYGFVLELFVISFMGEAMRKRRVKELAVRDQRVHVPMPVSLPSKDVCSLAF
jgi:hypothetical protein